jgi:hypothetical protein
MPFVVLNGDQDHTVAPACGQQAVDQWVRTDNLVLSGQQTTPIALAPSGDRKGAVPGGHAFDVFEYRGPDGRVLGEHWIIHGMDHYWSGGTTDPKYAQFTDPQGPNASAAAWAFFSRFRLSGTGKVSSDATSSATAPAAQTPAAPAIAAGVQLPNTSAESRGVGGAAVVALLLAGTVSRSRRRGQA